MSRTRKLNTATKIARETGHGLGSDEVKALGLHTSGHFVGAAPARNPIQRQEAPKRDDGLGEIAEATVRQVI